MSSNNEIFTPKKTYELVNQAFKIIINIKKYHIKNNKKPLNLDIIISLYKGFYAGFILLIELSDLPDYIKHDLIVKISIVDSIYS
jgi:hypothetical protein